jgi:UDP-N-acetyl-D-glucosamine dehydrogenase
MREHRFDLKSVPFTPAQIRRHDCVLIATNHSAFDYRLLRRNARLIVDTRGVYPRGGRNIVRA